MTNNIPSQSSKYGLPNQSPVLTTESAEHFDQLRNAFEQHYKPKNILQAIFVDELVNMTWEMWRMRRCKSGIINKEFLKSLEVVLASLKADADDKVTASDWFKTDQDKAKIKQRLADFGLDESAIEGQSFRFRGQDLERIDRMQGLIELRRERALRTLTTYVEMLSPSSQEGTNDADGNQDAPRSEEASEKKKAAA